MTEVLIVSNCDLGDVTFDSDVGSWNVTRAQCDCLAGKHKLYRFDVATMIANTENVEVDQDKIASMVADPTSLYKAPPVIFAEENGRIWLIDGHHRIRALHRLGFVECAAYVIDDAEGAPYRVHFNGKRVAPWIANKERA